MTPCANGHAPILHDEFHCPLCAALEDADGYEDAVQQAEDTIIDLKDHIEELSLADVLQLVAQVEHAEREADTWQRRFNTLAYEVRARLRNENKTQRLARIERVALEKIA